MMVGCGKLLVLLFGLAAVFAQVPGPSDTFSSQDADALKSLVLSAQHADGSFGPLKTTLQAVWSLNSLGAKVENQKGICTVTQAAIQDAADVATIHYAGSIGQILSCNLKPGPQVKDLLERALEGDLLVDYFHAVSAIAALGNKISIDSADVTPVAAKIAELADEDGTYFRFADDEEAGSPFLAGLALQTLAVLKTSFKLDESDNEIVSNAAASVEELLDLTEEVGDGLRFPASDASPLETTSTVLIGLNDLANALGAPIEGISKERISSLAEYFVSNKRATTVGDAYYILRSVLLLSDNKYLGRPLVLVLPQGSILATAKGNEGNVKIRVTDLRGRYAAPAQVFVTRVSPVSDDETSILNNQEAFAVGKDAKNVEYQFPFIASKPEAGFYNLEFRTVVQGKDNWIPVEGAVLPIKVVVSAAVSDLSMSVSNSADPEDAYGANQYSAQFPKSFSGASAGRAQHIHLSFRLKNAATGRNLKAQQVFVKASGKNSAIFPCTLRGKDYYLHLDATALSETFSGASGVYLFELIIGDSFIKNPIAWQFGDVNIELAEHHAESASDFWDVKPEIKHQFRLAEKRPSQQVSFIFTLAVLAPLLVLVVLLFSVGANISNFPTDTGFLSAVAFLGCICSILALYVFYWMRLNLLETIGYLGILAVPTLFFGRAALRNSAATSSKKD